MIIRRKTVRQVPSKRFFELFRLEGSSIKSLKCNRIKVNIKNITLRWKDKSDNMECTITINELKKLLSPKIIPASDSAFIRDIYLDKNKKNVKFGLLITRARVVRKPKRRRPRKTKVFKSPPPKGRWGFLKNI